MIEAFITEESTGEMPGIASEEVAGLPHGADFAGLRLG
jgi:hypothetical protein